MEDVKHAFDSFALEYDTQRDHVIPELQQFYGAAAWAAESPRQPPRILDIGAGTGMMSGLLLQKFPAATIVLMDFSERMLDVARQRFAGQPGVEVQGRRLPERGPRGACTTSSSRRSRSTTWNPGRSRGCSSGSTRRSCREGSSSTPTRRTARRRTSPGGTSSTGTSTSRPARWRTTSTRGSRNAGTISTKTTRSPPSSGGSARPVFTTSTWCTGTGPSSSPRRRSRAGPSPPCRAGGRGGAGHTSSSRTRRAVLERYGEQGRRACCSSGRGPGERGRPTVRPQLPRGRIGAGMVALEAFGGRLDGLPEPGTSWRAMAAHIRCLRAFPKEESDPPLCCSGLPVLLCSLVPGPSRSLDANEAAEQQPYSCDGVEERGPRGVPVVIEVQKSPQLEMRKIPRATPP